MNIELGILNDGGLMMVSDKPFERLVKRVEFYRDQRLFMLVYNDNDHAGDLMHYEIPETMTGPVEKSPDVIIYSLFENHDPIGYKVPLVKVGELY
ncbi:MAG: hypothetical protein KDJ35_04980 [Alphaproteobacteria bacterium]|nr:hypothetical protein [Alphaproteobacteria bacterium]